MKKTLISTILVLVLLATAGIVYASWEDTQSTQVTVNILPLPEDTFLFFSARCDDAIQGYGSWCTVALENASSTIMSIDAFTVTISYAGVTVTSQNGVGRTANPGDLVDILWDYTSTAETVPGEVTFEVEVTCLGN